MLVLLHAIDLVVDSNLKGCELFAYPDRRVNVRELPAYDNPPAVETVMGFHFAQIAGWSPLHLGQLFSVFEADYPNGEMLAPVVDLSLASRGGALNFLEAMTLRAAFSDKLKSQLVQVQQSFFLRNWRRVIDGQQYAHYPSNETSFVVSDRGVVIADDTFKYHDSDSLEDALTQLLGA